MPAPEQPPLPEFPPIEVTELTLEPEPSEPADPAGDPPPDSIPDVDPDLWDHTPDDSILIDHYPDFEVSSHADSPVRPAPVPGKVLRHTPRASSAASPAPALLRTPRKIRRASEAALLSTTPSVETPGTLRRRGAALQTPIVSELLSVGEIALWHGTPRSMKSVALMRLLLDLAAGDHPGFSSQRFSISRAWRVLYFTEEDAWEIIDTRLQGMTSARPDLPDPDLSNLGLVIMKGLDFDTDEGRAAILANIRAHQAEIVVFDPLRSFTGAADQGPSELRPVTRFLRHIQRETPAKTIILVHHDTKPSRDGVDLRVRAERASGGGIFSIAHSPVHFERAHSEGMLTHCYPTRFKTRKDPVPFSLFIDPQTWEFKVADITEFAGIEHAILDYVRNNPGCVTRDIREGVVGDNRLLLPRTQSLVKRGLIKVLDGPRNAKFHYLTEDLPPESTVNPVKAE